MRRLAIPALLAVLAGCQKPMAGPIGHRNAREPVRGGTLHAAFFTDVRNLDPAVAFDEGSHVFMQLVFDGLVDYDAGGKIVGRLAETFDVSSDGLRYTFRLRQHVTMHDGEELTADDVKRSIERALAHDTPCPVPSFYAKIAGYDAFHDGARGPDKKRVWADALSGVVVDGRYLLHIDLVEPDATFLPVMTLATVAPVCRSAGARYRRDWVTEACGAGPFKLASWEQAREIRVVRHPGYFQPGKPYLDEIQWQLMVPTVTQRFKFEAGELDYLRDLSLPDSIGYRRDPRWAPFGQWDPPKGTQGLFMNTEMPPFDNVELRRAVASAIDWEKIATLRAGHVVPTHQMVPPAVPGFDPSFAGQRYDLDAALGHMRSAGYPFDPATGKGGLPSPLHYLGVSDNFDSAAAQVYQQMLARIGVTIDLKIVSWPTYLAETGKRRRVQLGWAGWNLDYPDPSDFFEPTLSSDAIQDEETQNYAFYSSPELDGLLKKAHRELDPVARASMYRRCEEIVRDDAPWAVGYGYRFYELTQPYLHGYATDRTHTQDMREVWLDQPERQARLARTRRGLERDVLAIVRPFGRR